MSGSSACNACSLDSISSSLTPSSSAATRCSRVCDTVCRVIASCLKPENSVAPASVDRCTKSTQGQTYNESNQRAGCAPLSGAASSRHSRPDSFRSSATQAAKAVVGPSASVLLSPCGVPAYKLSLGSTLRCWSSCAYVSREPAYAISCLPSRDTTCISTATESSSLPARWWPLVDRRWSCM